MRVSTAPLLTSLTAGLLLASASQAQLDALSGALGPRLAAQDTLADSVKQAVPDTVKYQSQELEYDADTRYMLLTGTAQLEYRGTLLTADSVAYNQETGILDAWGHPDIKDASLAPFQGDRLRYSMRTREGSLVQGRSYQGGDYYRGREIRRLPNKNMHVLDGDFCQCKGVNGPPDYWFSSNRMEIEPGKLAVAAPVVLNIAEVPVLVAPFVLFPLGKERRSGILPPKFKGDQAQGFSMDDLGFYWGMSDYSDLTVTTDIMEGPQGRFDKVSGSANLRYLLRYWLSGNLAWTQYVNQLGGAGSGWEASYSHDQQLLPEPDRFTLKGDGNFVSSRSVRSDNALSAQQVLDQTANAQLNMQYKGDLATTTLSARQNANLRSGLATREIPHLTVSIPSRQLFPSDDPEDLSLWRSIYGSYLLEASIWQDQEADSGADTTVRPRILDYRGASQRVSLSASQKVLDYLQLSAHADAIHDWTMNSYSLPVQPAGVWRPFDPDQWDPDQSIKWNTGVAASTELYGIWLPYWGRFAGLRHTLTPGVDYTFFPHIEERDWFVANPALRQTPGQTKSQLITLSLGQKLDAKILAPKGDSSAGKVRKGTPLSLITLGTSTNYDFEKTVRPWGSLSTSGNTGLLGAIQLNGNMTHSFYNKFSADSISLQAPMLMAWSLGFSRGLQVSGSMADGFVLEGDTSTYRPWSVQMNYDWSTQSTRVARSVFRETRSQSASIGVDLNPTREWKATWRSTYNFDAGEFVAHSLDFQRGLGCWNLNFGWIPVGPARGWSFQILIRDLPDIKVQARSTSIRKTTTTTTP